MPWHLNISVEIPQTKVTPWQFKLLKTKTKLTSQKDIKHLNGFKVYCKHYHIFKVTEEFFDTITWTEIHQCKLQQIEKRNTYPKLPCWKENTGTAYSLGMVSYKNIGSKTIIHEIPVKETKAVFSKFEKKINKQTKHFQAKLLYERCVYELRCLKSNEDMILALTGQFKQLSHEPEKFRWLPLSHLNFSDSWDNCLNCPVSARIISSFD